MNKTKATAENDMLHSKKYTTVTESVICVEKNDTCLMSYDIQNM